MPTVYLCSDPFAHVLNEGNLTIITPNFQAARSLGITAVTLQDLALEALASLRLASVISATRLLRGAVGECLASSEPVGLAKQIAPQLRALMRSGACFEQLEQADSFRARQLGMVGKTYRQMLLAENLIDEADLLWTAIDRNIDKRPILVRGYYRLGLDGRAFVDAVADELSVVLLPYQEGQALFEENRQAAEYLVDRGWQLEYRESQTGRCGSRAARVFVDEGTALGIDACVYPDLDAEVRSTLAQVQDLLQKGIAARQICIVSRDIALYAPTIQAIAWEYGLEISLLHEISLGQTIPGSWLSLLLECLENDFSYAETLALLAHPLGGGLTVEQRVQVRLVHPANSEEWQSVGVSIPEWAHQKISTRLEWIAQLRAVLEAFKFEEQLQNVPKDKLVWESFQAALEELTEGEESIDEAFYFSEVRELLAIVRIAYDRLPGAVEVHPPISVFGARFDHLFILGLAEGQFPAAVADDPFLDFHERRLLERSGIAVDTAAVLARREALGFYAALHSADQNLTLSYPKRIDRTGLLPSPYFRRLGLKPKAVAVRYISPEEIRRRDLGTDSLTDDPVMSTAREALRVEARRESTAAHDEHDGMVGVAIPSIGRVFSATQIVALGQCPFRWFAGWLLKLKEAPAPLNQLAANQLGLLYHKVLEEATKRVLDAEDQRSALLAVLDKYLSQTEHQFGLTALVGWPLRRGEILATLERAVRSEDFLQTGARIIAMEQKFKTTWRELQVTGSVDRIDRSPQGLILVDYKSGSSAPTGAKNRDGKTNIDIQLPLYLEAAAPALYPEESVAGAYYFSVGKGEKISRRNPAQADLEWTVEQAKQALDSGSFPVQPDVAGQACTYCAYDGLCRRGPRLEGKGATCN